MLGGINSFIDGLNSVFESAKNFLGFEGADPEIKQISDNYFAGIDANPATAGGNSSLANTSSNIQRNTSVSVDKVNVDARGGDSQEIAAGVGNALKDQMQQTVSNFDDAVVA